MKKDKRGVSSIIATVLMIVIVIAAIIILGGIVLNYIKNSVPEDEDPLACINNRFTIEGIESNGPYRLEFSLKKTSGDSTVNSILFRAKDTDGTIIGTRLESSNIPNVGETKKMEKIRFNTDLNADNTQDPDCTTGNCINFQTGQYLIEIYPIIDGNECPIADSMIEEITP